MFEFSRLFFLTWRLLQRSLPHQQDLQGTVHRGVCQTQDHQPQIRLLLHTGNSTSIFTISCTMLRFSSERTKNSWRKEALLFWGELAEKYGMMKLYTILLHMHLLSRGELVTVHDHAITVILIIMILLILMLILISLLNIWASLLIWLSPIIAIFSLLATFCFQNLREVIIMKLMNN